VENDICYLTICDKAYPRKLAFDFLSELAREFFSNFGNEVPQVTRPYAFVKFGMFGLFHFIPTKQPDFFVPISGWHALTLSIAIDRYIHTKIKTAISGHSKCGSFAKIK
jgi:hypothetical protein